MGSIIPFIAFVCILVGVFLVTNTSPKQFIQEISQLFTREKQQSLRYRIEEAQGRKKKNYFIRQVDEARSILKMHQKEEWFPIVCGASFLFAVGGALFSVMIKNYYLFPVLFFGLSLAPFIYVKFLGIQLNKQMNQELETALSIVTSSYIRSQDIIIAVEENMAYINPPVSDVFEQFILEAKLLNPDIKKLIREMKKKVNNEIFQEWCDALITCQDDSTLKSTLQPIVKKLSNVRIVSVELDNMLYAPVKEHVSMCILVIANIPLMYFLNKNWYDILVHQTAGKIILAVNIAIIFISSMAVIKISQPVKYKR